MSFLGIIPARYASVRFPGKPLALLGNKPVIQWVYERSKSALKEVYVATDDERIFNEVKSFGGEVVMTSGLHPSGTDRCAEALEIISKKSVSRYTHVINIQGDEPFIHEDQIRMLRESFTDELTDIATLAKRITNRDEIFDVNKPKVVFCRNHFALYFSRSPIPYVRNLEISEWPGSHPFYKHIGIYAYKADVLMRLSLLPSTPLEIAESLEQLRWLQNGFRIYVSETEHENIGIDTENDLEKARSMIR